MILLIMSHYLLLECLHCSMNSGKMVSWLRIILCVQISITICTTYFLIVGGLVRLGGNSSNKVICLSLYVGDKGN